MLTVLQRVVTLPVVLLVIYSMAMDHGSEALEEVLRHHAFLEVVFVSHAVDGMGDTLCLVLLTLLLSKWLDTGLLLTLLTPVLRHLLTLCLTTDVQVGGLENKWIMDSGCSRHMTGNDKWFSSLTSMRSKEYIVFGIMEEKRYVDLALFEFLIALP